MGNLKLKMVMEGTDLLVIAKENIRQVYHGCQDSHLIGWLDSSHLVVVLLPLLVSRTLIMHVSI